MNAYPYPCVCLVLLSLLWLSSAQGESLQAKINSLTPGQGQIELHGLYFGEMCESCGVIGNYDSLLYQHEILHWSDNSLLVRTPDFNLGDSIKLRVHREGRYSGWISAPVLTRVIPAEDLSEIVTLPPKGLAIFDFRSDQSVGAKGDHHYAVSHAPPICGEPALLFDHARILFRARRFGDAQIISTPSPGCTQCEPIVVRWYHEPTGRLDYQLQVYHRLVDAPCSSRILERDPFP